LRGVTPGRRAALDVLRAVRRGALADRALADAVARLDPRERAWTQELVYGTLRLRGRIDHMLAPLVRRGLAKLEPDVLDTLRLAAYQLLEMDAVPDYAAVSQAVEQARRVGGRGADRLVNGVLRAWLARGAPPDWPDEESDPAGFLATWGSHPRWLVERWIGRWGAEETRRLVEANNRRPELYLRPIGVPVAEALRRLAAAGIAAEPVAFAPDSVRLVPPASVSDALAAVPAVVQDPAAALVVRYAAVPPGGLVADLAAAPGGKALALAVEARYTVAADASFSRMGKVRENAQRLGASRLGLLVADARRPPLRDGAADAVLLDVPCTGTGTFRRHPDARWRLRPEDLAALTALQRELLEAAAALPRPGGLLIYSTCSLEPEENEAQVDWFLERHPEYVIRPPAGFDPALLDARGCLTVLPQRTGVDGAFAARLERRA
jgi:16S rRNA (cytosine967-C5)-methyltransferase